MSRTFGVALEHRAALMGIAVHPVARSESVSENTKRAIFAQLSVSGDYSDHERVQRYVHDDHCTDCQSLDIVEIASIHVDDSGVSDVVSPRWSTNFDTVIQPSIYNNNAACYKLLDRDAVQSYDYDADQMSN